MVYYRGGSRPGRIQKNVLYFSDQRSTFFATRRKVQSYPGDFNCYYNAANPKKSAAFLEKLQQSGADVHSISADPLFVDLKNADFALRPNSPTLKLGFKQIDMTKIGLRDDFPDRYR